MIELRGNQLVFSFTGVHPDAKLTIEFQRTLRIPDDGKKYPLPPGLGAFPVRDVDDYAKNVPPEWVDHGGVMLPMYQSEAMWILFRSQYLADRQAAYPFAIKVAAGKVCAVSGKTWTNDLVAKPQNFVISPNQPWLDGFCVSEGTIRQFVAMPLGAGYTAEEQVTGKAEHGGLQLLVSPMRREAFDLRFPIRPKSEVSILRPGFAPRRRAMSKPAEMGLAPGGQMRQQIYASTYPLAEWDTSERSRCFVHIVNSMVWQSSTGQLPPHAPLTAKQYAQLRLPWFDYYDDTVPSLAATSTLTGLKSVAEIGAEKGDVPLPENESAEPTNLKHLGPKKRPGEVRQGRF